jgi:hypothetical protein
MVTYSKYKIGPLVIILVVTPFFIKQQFNQMLHNRYNTTIKSI